MADDPKVEAFLSTLSDDDQVVMRSLHKQIKKAIPKAEVVLWEGGMANNTIGYGTYIGKDSKGKEVRWYLVGIARRKAFFSAYIVAFDPVERKSLINLAAAELGNVKLGSGCVNFKKLEDLNVPVFLDLAKQAWKLQP